MALFLFGTERAAVAAGGCGNDGRPWVSVEFAEEAWPLALKEAIFRDLEAGLTRRSIDTCAVDNKATVPPVAAIRLSFVGSENVQVTVEIRDAITDKRVGRDVNLSSLPADGRALAIALAADELVWATWAEIGIKNSPRRKAAPAEVVTAVEQSYEKPSRGSVRLGAAFAAEHFGAGLVRFGADALCTFTLAQRFQLRIAAGYRQGLAVSAPDGHVHSMATGVASDLAILLNRSSHIELAWTLGSRADWAVLQGDAQAGALDHDLRGFALYARTGLNAAIHPTRPIWFEIGATLGAPLRALQATDAGRTVTGIAGLEQGASIAVMGEL